MRRTSEFSLPSDRSPGMLSKLVLFALAVLVAGALSEALVRLVKPGYPGFRLPQVEHRPVPGIGFEMVPRQNAFTWASPARINSLGFRGPELRDPPGRPLVFCVGDSMTFGNSVTEDATYAHQLQQLLAREWPSSRPETINMGVQRYFAYQEMELVKMHAPRLRPAVVTLAIYVNDLGVRPSGDFVREYEKEREEAATAFRNVAPSLYLLLKNSATIELLKRIYYARNATESTSLNALAGIVATRDEPKWQGLERELLTFRELAQTFGFRPYVVFVPARQQVQSDLPDSLYPRRLVKYTRDIGLIAIDPIESFKRELKGGRDPYLPWDDHMSQTGHRLIAEALVEPIRRDAPTILRQNLGGSELSAGIEELGNRQESEL